MHLLSVFLEHTVQLTMKNKIYFLTFVQIPIERTVHNELLGDPEVTENIYCKSRNLPNTDTQNYSTDLR